jgi:hypothetical protein
MNYPWATPLPWESRHAKASNLLKNFAWYRENHLFIRPREGGARKPFHINAAQTVLDRRLNSELKEFGNIRALVPKARRMGVSTYISARFFHRTATQRGKRAHVVAHRNDSATNIHREVKEFYNGLPEALQPSIGASNAREVLFDKLQSAYKVSSAEGGDIGRSDDTHLLHMSEAGFFDNSEDLSSGLMKTVLDVSGTEIIMESTGNGASGMFFDMCEQAHRDRNKGLWRLHFLAWHIMPEYIHEPPVGWEAPREFADYGRMHGLSPAQLYWYWRENYTLAVMNGGTPDTIHRLTKQEFPATYAECFMTDSTLDFFPASLVQEAMLSVVEPTAGALKIISVDPAGDGSDDPWVCDRQGCVIGKRIWGAIKSKDQNVQADWLVSAFRRFNMDAIVIDSGGLGKGLVDACRLRMRGQADRIVAVNFGSGANNAVHFGNKRSELHFKFNMWLQGQVRMPNDKTLQAECAAYKWGTGGCRRDELARLFMTPKEKIRMEIGHSPDRLDAIVNSFGVNDYALQPVSRV